MWLRRTRPARRDSEIAPISDYAVLSNCQGAALVSRDGSIDWACLQRFDAPSVFGRLLGPAAGHWRIGPTAPTQTTRRYLPDTMVLRSEFATDAGVVAVTDACPLAEQDSEHQIGRHAPHGIIRIIEGVTGEVEVAVDLVLRPEYGLTVPVVIEHPGGLRTLGGCSYLISSEVPLERGHGTLGATLTVSAGDRYHFAVEASDQWPHEPHAAWSSSDIDRLMDATIAGWRSWSKLHQSYDGPYADLVLHSGRVLQALTYAPSGAIVAAPTTSLPEQIGGARNWDYRYCWVRDASLTMGALWVAACPDEAHEFFDFLATAAGTDVDACGALQILYSVSAERFVPEHELEHLPGYRDSRPVRIGNGAWNQTQLDVYGELLAAAVVLADQITSFDPVTAQFLIGTANTAAARWTERDRGIWEVRGAPRHFVYSKLMCWAALDSAIKLAELLDAAALVDHWASTRDEIRAAIETRGWSKALGAFAQAFDADELDASALMMLIVGFLPPDDPRMRATVERIANDLTDSNGFVVRYRNNDGLPGHEGSFTICTFWLAQCWALLGETAKARELFEHVVSYANDVGLLSEQLDSATGEQLGNFPQAFTHIGLVNAAWTIGQAQG